MIKITKTEAALLAGVLREMLDAQVKYMAESTYRHQVAYLEAAARRARRIDELRRRARRGAK